MGEIDPVLVERFARGNGTIFVGAGVSRNSGLPDWQGLIDELKADIGSEAAKESNYLQIAELYEAKHNRAILVQYLARKLANVRVQPARIHELIVSLPVQRIYTTNFDPLLELACRKVQLERQPISKASQIGLSDASTQSIVKLHGDLADPESIVVTARDYYSYLLRNPAIADLLKVELQTRTVLFIGYSFSDPNLAMILSNAMVQGGPINPLLYSVQFQPGELAVRALRARGVKVIPINEPSSSPAAGKAIVEWLVQFRQALINFDRRKQRLLDGRQAYQALTPVSVRRHSTRLAQIDQRMRNALSSGYRVIVVKGEPGAGKSHVTAEAALNRLQPDNTNFHSEVFERVIWVRAATANGRPGHHTLEAIFHAIASQVEASLSTDERDKESQERKIDAILLQQRLLIVIEDLEDPRGTKGFRALAFDHADHLENHFDEIKRWLERGGSNAHAGSRIIVTTRSAAISGYAVQVTRLEEADAERLIREYASVIMLRMHYELDDRTVMHVIKFTAGNPLAIRLSLGLLNGTGNGEWLGRVAEDAPIGEASIESRLEKLVHKLWAALDNEEARRVLVATVIFPAGEWVPVALIAHAAALGGAPDAIAQLVSHAVQRCVCFGLLEYDAALDACLMHRTTREFLMSQECVTEGERGVARERLASYLLKFLNRDDVLRRKEIKDPYWNTLVRDEMVKVDPYWPTIEGIMYLLEDTPQIVQFTLLLIHYMDSRFMNAQRLHFVNKSIKACGAKDQRTLALLHIDALGWTYVEEGRLDDALRHIDLGATLLTEDDSDLHALALAWRARIAASNDKLTEAARHLDAARPYFEACREKGQHWVVARFSMMKGDFQLLEERPREAEAAYLEAERSEERYGGELGYQTDWRIGLALLGQAGEKPSSERSLLLDQARHRFNKLAGNPHVANGRLYGQYGLALISAKEQSTQEAALKLRNILKEIEVRRGEDNVLLKLAKKAYDDLVSRGHP